MYLNWWLNQLIFMPSSFYGWSAGQRLIILCSIGFFLFTFSTHFRLVNVPVVDIDEIHYKHRYEFLIFILCVYSNQSKNKSMELLVGFRFKFTALKRMLLLWHNVKYCHVFGISQLKWFHNAKNTPYFTTLRFAFFRWARTARKFFANVDD